MKKLSFLILFLQFSFAWAEDKDDFLSYEHKDIKLLALDICGQLEIAKGSGNQYIGKNIEERLLKFIDIKRDNKDHKKIIGNFLDKNIDSFICPSSTNFRKRHIFKRVVDMEMQQAIFYNYLLSEKYSGYKIDINAVEYIDGVGETLLDYLLKLKREGEDYKSNWSFRFKINDLEEIIVEDFGAKKASELKANSN